MGYVPAIQYGIKPPFEIYATAIPLALDDGPKVAQSIFSMLYFEYGWMEIKKQEKILITISYHFCM